MRQKSLILATRESQLALWQANWVKECLENAHDGLSVELLPMSTKADRSPYLSLQAHGGKGLFVKELEEALLAGRADFAVHCMKDMPVGLPEGLTLAAFCVRETPYDVFISNRFADLAALPAQAVIGTSSLRRTSQLLHLRPDLVPQPLRGNVITRLTRLDNDEYDAIILAAAGLKRLGLLGRMREVLVNDAFLPAAGQGILGLECRQEDVVTQRLLQALHHTTSAICVTAERAVCKRLGAQCQTPVAAYAELQENDQLLLKAFVGSPDGQQSLHAQLRGSAADPETLGLQVGDMLLAKGAAAILQACLNH